MKNVSFWALRCFSGCFFLYTLINTQQYILNRNAYTCQKTNQNPIDCKDQWVATTQQDCHSVLVPMSIFIFVMELVSRCIFILAKPMQNQSAQPTITETGHRYTKFIQGFCYFSPFKKNIVANFL